MKLADKVAIITGAGRGIGAALAIGFAREGASVVVNYSHSEEGARRVVDHIEQGGGRAVAVHADVACLEEHSKLIQAAVGSFGRLDILVNNAAIDRRVGVLEAKPEDWDGVFAVNLRGAFFLAQKAAREMTGEGGAILNVASVHDEKAHRNNSIYTITKGAMKLMTRCMALELAGCRIRVNSLSPGAILTDMNRAVLSDAEYRRKVIGEIPLGRIGNTEELIGAAILLVSQEGSYITGTTLYVDGGLLL